MPIVTNYHVVPASLVDFVVFCFLLYFLLYYRFPDCCCFLFVVVVVMSATFATQTWACLGIET